MESEFPALEKLITHFLPIVIPVIGFALVGMFKSNIVEFFQGIKFRFNRDFNEDQEILLEKEKAIITKIGIFNTKVYMIYPDGTMTMRKFKNSAMEKLRMEKLLEKKT